MRMGPELAKAMIRVEIGLEVREMHVKVAMGEKRIGQRGKDARLMAAEIIGEDQVESGASLGFMIVMPMGIVPATAVSDLLGREAEEEEVVFAGGFGHFDGGAVASADSEGAVHHEFHVAGAAGFV